MFLNGVGMCKFSAITSVLREDHLGFCLDQHNHRHRTFFLDTWQLSIRNPGIYTSIHVMISHLLEK